VIVHFDDKYIEFITSGLADKDGSQSMAKLIAATLRKHKMRKVLVDHRKIEKVSGSVIEIYERPRLFKIIGVILGIKIAEIINPAHYDHFKFLETVCVNQGYKFSIFYDRAAALEWLLR
jgi:hypothetical protein